MSFSKNTVAACFTLALLISSSHGAELAGAIAPPPSHGGVPAQCFERTAIKCRSDSDHTMCLTICLEKEDGPYIGGYCSKSARSCYCSKRCVISAQTPGGAAGPGPAAA